MDLIPRFKDQPSLDINPFLPELVQNLANNIDFVKRTVKTKNSRGAVSYTKNYPDGTTETIYEETKYYDEAAFVKLYTGHLRIFHSLTVKELDILEFLVSMLKSGANKVDAPAASIMAAIGCSKPTVYNALSKLISRGLIAKYRTDSYFINPTVMFKGDRISMIVNAIKKS